jgi:hypothetical protein
MRAKPASVEATPVHKEARKPRERSAQPARERREGREVREEHGIRYQVSDAESTTGSTTNEPQAPRSKGNSDSKEIYVNAGRQDGVTEDELKALLERQGIATTDIKRIAVRFRNSFIQVPAAALQQALTALNGQTLHERALVAEESRAKPSR